MERFLFRIRGEHLERAMAALNNADIPTIGVFPAYFVSAGVPDDFKLEGLIAVFTDPVSGEDEARDLVKRCLDDLPGTYTIESATR